MMVEDFGGGVTVRSYDSALSNYELKEQVKALKKELKEANEELSVYRMAPLRRTWHTFKNVVEDWIPLIVIVGVVGMVLLGCYLGNKYNVQRDLQSCEFAAKIQSTKFEFDTINKKCYLYEPKFDRYLPHGIKNPD